MAARARLKLVFWLNVAIVLLLVGYKVYLNFFAGDYETMHPRAIREIEASLEGKERFSFAVVGNINNSIGIFERKILPMLNASGVDFVVSAGNAVSGGGEDKYRALSGSLGHLDVPCLLTFGPREASNFGAFRYYDRFGPYFFSFTAGNSRFIFLDSTGETSFDWQLHWLEEQLRERTERHAFVFMSHPLFESGSDNWFASPEDHFAFEEVRERLVQLFSRHGVRAVFSANLPVFARHSEGGTEYVTTGGAGGLVMNDDDSFYHYVKVSVDGARVDIAAQPLDIGQHPVFRTLEGLWLFIHSLFYVGYLNFLLIVSIFTLIAIKLYVLIFTDRDYYPSFDVDGAPWLDEVRRVAMFANNYLPFIGGVPISIDRLRRGLDAAGRETLVVAPDYRRRDRGDAPRDGSCRLPPLFIWGEKREFRLANIFHPRVHRAIRDFRPDIIHCHHPIWCGSLGLLWARRLGVPAVYTYHTRLEHYAHFVRSIPGPLFRNLISHYLVRRFSNKCDGVIVPTYSAEEYLRLIGVKTDIFVLPTGIEFERFNRVDAGAVAALKGKLGIGEERVLVTVSRLSREKNLDFLLEAVALLKRELHQPFRFVIIGDGPERRRIEARIGDLGLAEVIILAGAVKPEVIPRYYHLGDLFLFASKTETQGMVLLEAMAAGLPCIAVRSSGIDDVIRDGVTGFKTAEDRRAWCRRVRELLECEPLRREMSEAAVAFARNHSIDRFTESVLAIYAHLLAKRARRAMGASA
ncbi:MAG TPA: glycosyltransferase [Gammaproteobacteria bacterium]|nr:glycosyltransferase [Gammaproteobacteria bacterium]